MSFKLRIRGRDYFESSTAANSANPLIPEEALQISLPTASNEATVQDLTQHTISKLAGLAGPAIEKAMPYPRLSDAEHQSASLYHQHHFGCKTCCGAGQGRGNRCEIGMPLWDAYQSANTLQIQGATT